MDHSQLSSAFYRVGLVADQTWWTNNDFTDDYKLASLELWNEVIHSNERLSNLGLNSEQMTNPSNPKPSENVKKDKLSMPTSRMEVAQMQKALASMDPSGLAPLPQSTLTDTKRVLSANWPQALLKTYPAISNTLKDATSKSVFSHQHAIGGIYQDGNTLPYSIDNVEELMLHKRIRSSSVRSIWSNDNESTHYRDRLSQTKDMAVSWEHGLNANVPEFYPSVLLPPRQCPPRYSNVFGANYQSEVFPYNEDKTGEKKENEGVNRKKKSRRGTSERRSTMHAQGIASSPSPNLLKSKAADKNSPRTKEREAARADINFWLQNVYPHRILDLSKFRAIARHLEMITHRIVLPFPPVVTTSTPAPSSFTPTSERRLYRDVLARKIEEGEDKIKDDSEQNPFDELERQALEQYQSSETCLVPQTNGTDLNPDPEDRKFQDLEREALEQYTEDADDQVDESSSSRKVAEIKFSDRTPLLVSNVELIPGKVSFMKNPVSQALDAYRPVAIEGSSSTKTLLHKKPGEPDKGDFDDAPFAPESIVKSVVEDDKFNDEKGSDMLGLLELKEVPYGMTKAFGAIYNNKSKSKKKNNKKKKKRQGDEEIKYYSNKQLPASATSRTAIGTSTSFQLPNVINLEEETRRLATNLKQRVLNYLRSVDLKIISDDNRRANAKQQLLKDLDRPIQERVKVVDIEDLETYKSYIREVSMKARSTLLAQFKRIRSDIMESASRGIVSLVSPTTSEKRKVRKIIKKCLELRNHADTKTRNQLNTAKRDVNETLEIVHNTMEVIYTLRNWSKETYEDVDYLKCGRAMVVDLYTESVRLEDKSEYIKQRVMLEERSVLLVVLFPRVPGVLYNRSYEGLKKPNCRAIYYDHDLLRTDYTNLLRNISTPAENKLEPKILPSDSRSKVKVYNMFKFLRMGAKAIWDPNNWSHIAEIGKNRRRINMNFLSTSRQAEAFHRILSKQPPIKLFSHLENRNADEGSSGRKRQMCDSGSGYRFLEASDLYIQADDMEIQCSTLVGARGKLKAIGRKPSLGATSNHDL